MPATVITLPAPKHRRWVYPDWPRQLSEGYDGFHCESDDLNRSEFDLCARAVGPYNAPALLSDLVSEGSLELGRLDMAGAVAAVWSTSAFAESALARVRWVELLRSNGFSVDGQRADLPAEPVQLWRGCVPGFIGIDATRRLAAMDPHGNPVNRYDDDPEVVEVWHSSAGMAWTASSRAARWFAFRGPVGRAYGRVFTARIAPRFLLAQIGDNVIVDPAGLDAGQMAEAASPHAVVAR
jgi:hypothetical protein